MGNRSKSEKRKPRGSETTRTLRRSTLIIGMIIGLAFSLIMGITAGARGLGSIYPQLNLVTKPFVCAGGEMTYSRSVSDIGSATYYSARWFCVNRESNERTEIDSN